MEEAQVMVDHASGRSRGFGFVTFDDETSVDAVFEAGSMHEISGKRVEVKSATPKGSGPQGRGPGPAFMGRNGMAGGGGGGRGFSAGGRGYGYGMQQYPGYQMPGEVGGGSSHCWSHACGDHGILPGAQVLNAFEGRLPICWAVCFSPGSHPATGLGD